MTSIPNEHEGDTMPGQSDAEGAVGAEGQWTFDLSTVNPAVTGLPSEDADTVVAAEDQVPDTGSQTA